MQVEATLVVRMAMRLNYAAFIMQQSREVAAASGVVPFDISLGETLPNSGTLNFMPAHILEPSTHPATDWSPASASASATTSATTSAPTPTSSWLN